MTQQKTIITAIIAIAAACLAVAGVFFVTQHFKKPERLFDTGKAYYEEKDYDSALAYFASAIERNPRKAEYHYWKGMAFHKKKDYSEAIAAYTEAIRLEPDNAKAYAYRGGAYIDGLECDRLTEESGAKALDDFYRSIDLNPNYAVRLPEISGAVFEYQNENNSNQLFLTVTALITDSLMTLGAEGGFMPSIFYREFHRYITKGGLDTLIEYAPDKRPVNQRTGKAFTEDERVDIYLYSTDYETHDIVYVMYTKSGEMLTNANGYPPLKSVSVGDTVYALANPRRMIVVSDLNEFESRPLSAYDELLNILTKIKERYRDAEDTDTDDFVIAIEEGGDCNKIMKIIYAARIAGYTNIYVARYCDVFFYIRNMFQSGKR